MKTTCHKCKEELVIGLFIYRDGMTLCYTCHDEFNELIGKWLD
jgi:hypothetical protein